MSQSTINNQQYSHPRRSVPSAVKRFLRLSVSSVSSVVKKLFDSDSEHIRARNEFRRRWLDEEQQRLQARQSDALNHQSPITIPQVCLSCDAACSEGERDMCAIVHAWRGELQQKTGTPSRPASTPRVAGIAENSLRVSAPLRETTSPLAHDSQVLADCANGFQRCQECPRTACADNLRAAYAQNRNTLSDCKAEAPERWDGLS